MSTENTTKRSVGQESPKSDVSAETKYKRVVAQDAEQADALPVDYRRVQHGHGPCSCCGPYSE